jgi:TolB-like protein
VLNRSLLLLLILFGAAGLVQADSNVVVVFPFDNLSNDRTLDWIGEGISELIIQRLRPEHGV